MTSILPIGIDPRGGRRLRSDLPRGTPETIAAATLSDMKALGREGASCPIRADGSAEATVAASPRGLPLFERIVDVVHRGPPSTPIAFNTSPDDTADAAARWSDGVSPAYRLRTKPRQ